MNKSSANPVWRSAALLAVIAVLGSGLLASIHWLTEDRIEAQQRRMVLQQLNQVLAADRYDNNLHEDWIEVHEPVRLRQTDAVRVYRARSAGQPVAVIMKLTAPDGYNGGIDLLIGIDVAQRITGVRVLAHRETPGLGDPIELKRSAWILDFDGRSLEDPAAQYWQVQKDGGVYTQFTGATITPRAVVAAVRRALEYHGQEQTQLYAPAPAPAERDP